MSTDHRTALASIKRFDQLIAYLRDEMGWPIDRIEIDDLMFDYTPEELGIDPKNAAKIEEIKRLRPLSTKQPWGIFFVKFEPKRLPVVVLRRILGQVVLKKRASSKAADRAAWQVGDLLFISNYGDGDARQISFAHFSQPEEKDELPTLKVLGWDNLDTPLHLDAVAKELTEHLSWPEDDGDVEAWRNQWRSAFTLGHREVITTSKQLSIALAKLARAIRDRIKTALAIETERGPLTKLMNAFRDALVHDLDADGFADMYAQTIAYGLLSARITDPKSKTADDFAHHMRTNPFLKELMETFLHVGGRRSRPGEVAIDFDELGVNDVVDLLDQAKMDRVVADFGDRNPQEDPVIHFYESFLKEYDARKRMERGVFYTPRQVVSYIVRSVHELLRTDFELQDGLADVTTWGEILRRHKDIAIPDGVSPEQPFVQILDPATGTGTFLVEVIEVIHRTLIEKWKKQGHGEEKIATLWNDYVSECLLPRLHGYELLMAPYAIAHLKIGLKLYETGYHFGSDQRARVFLTNALDPPSDVQFRISAMPALAHEAQAVNELKRKQRFTVVIGNPPYSVSSWNANEWITSLVEDYKRTVRSEESQIQALSNDYIKFLRLGQWLIEQSHIGLVGMITGHGYLQGTQPRDLRRALSITFQHVFCLDLHGSIRRSGTGAIDDEPVFQIMTGVAILVASRVSATARLGQTIQASLVGPLTAKFSFLLANTAPTLDRISTWHVPTQPNYYYTAPVTSDAVASEYQSFLDLPVCFGTGDRQRDKEKYWATGFASQQDDLAISFTVDELAGKMAALAASESFAELCEDYRLCTTDQWNYANAKEFARKGLWQTHIRQVAYRPFDQRWSVFDKHVLTILRNQVMSQLGSTDSIGLVSSRAVNDIAFAHCFVVDAPVDKIFISSKTSTNAYVFPLYTSLDGIAGRKYRPNLSRPFIAALARAIGSEKAVDADGLPAGVTAQDMFNYIYAVLHAPQYRNRYAEFLKIDFPRLPLPGTDELFRDLARLGSELVALHLMESSTLDRFISTYTGPKNPMVTRIGWSNDTVWLDAAATKKGELAERGTIGFRGVPEEVWNFHIGGYQVCEKWLKDRKGRTLSDDDIAHYHKIVVALAETIRVMQEIDDVIERHGGWPGAFYSSPRQDLRPEEESVLPLA